MLRERTRSFNTRKLSAASGILSVGFIRSVTLCFTLPLKNYVHLLALYAWTGCRGACEHRQTAWRQLPNGHIRRIDQYRPYHFTSNRRDPLHRRIALRLPHRHQCGPRLRVLEAPPPVVLRYVPHQTNGLVLFHLLLLVSEGEDSNTENSQHLSGGRVQGEFR